MTRLDVQRGQKVARGAPVFALDASSERDARDRSRRGSPPRAQAANTTKGRRSDEIAVTQAQLAQAQAQADLADAELARRRALVAQNFISAAQLDDAKAAAEQAHGRVAELQAALRVAQLPARSDERVAAAATAQAASAALAQAAWREQQKQQSAPADALVSDTFFQVGEWVNAGQPVVALLPPTATRARFYVAEAEVGAIAAGQRVLIECSGCGAAIAGRIERIATQPEYTPPVIYSNAQRSRPCSWSRRARTLPTACAEAGAAGGRAAGAGTVSQDA
ncbi:MAG: HlyD family efflux transporter periplasmic adaptor subunit [Rubrivivax sp.]